MERAGSKRKRSGTSYSSSQPPSRLPSEAINPLSHTPSILSQFLVAGLDDSHEVPSRLVLDFPHRPWRDPGAARRPRRRKSASSVLSSGVEADGETSEYATTTDGETEPETDAESTTSLPKTKSYAAERAALRPLARSIAVFLSRDDIPAAKRAFGLLMRSRISGRKVDIRRNHYWELGAEILMRERPIEEKSHNAFDIDPDDKKFLQTPHQRPLYPVANIPRVRKYFEDLILQFPHHLTARRAASALQFHPALLSYEIYQIYTQYVRSIEQVQVDSETWEPEQADDMDMQGLENADPGNSEYGMDYDADSSLRTRRFGSLFAARETRLQLAKDEIRSRTLDSMRVIAESIGKLLDDSTFAMSGEILRLGGIVSLFIADLVVPTNTPRLGEREEAEKRREAERDKARGYFEKAMQRGAHIDAPIREALGMEDDDDSEEPVVMLTFSSLPIRDHRE